MSALALALLLPSTLAMQWGTSVSSDTSGGSVSVAPGVSPRPTLSTSLNPSVVFGLDAGNGTLGARYGIRLFRRFELSEAAMGTQQIAEINRFLIMHNAGVSAGLRLARGWSINADVSMDIGEVDVPSAQGVLQQQPTNNTRAGQAGIPTPVGQPGTPTAPANQANAPGSFLTQNGTLATAMITGGLSLSGRLDKALSFNLAFQGSYSGPLSSTSTAAGGFAQPEQSSLGTTISVGRKLTRNDALNGSATASFSFSPLIGDFRSITVLVGYSRRLGRYTTATANVGLLSIAQIKAPDSNIVGLLPPPPSSLSPAFTLGFATQLLNLRDVRASLNLSSAISPQQNFATGAFEPRLNNSVGLSFSIGTKWSVGLNAVLGTIATFTTTDPSMAGGTVIAQQQFSETNFALQVPISYRVSNEFSLGASFSVNTIGERLANGLGTAFQFPSYQATLSARFSLSQNI